MVAGVEAGQGSILAFMRTFCGLRSDSLGRQKFTDSCGEGCVPQMAREVMVLSMDRCGSLTPSFQLIHVVDSTPLLDQCEWISWRRKAVSK